MFLSVLMKGITWSRDSHGLFDYESRHLTKKTLRAQNESMIMRTGNDLSIHRYHPSQSFVKQIDTAKKEAEEQAKKEAEELKQCEMKRLDRIKRAHEE